MLRGTSIFLSLWLCGCASTPGGPNDSGAATDSGDAACADDQAAYGLTWENWGAGFMSTYCNACHAADTPERFGAPEGVSFDTLAEVRSWEQRIRVRVLDQETMPLGGGVYPDDLLLLESFLDCSL